MRYTNKSGFTLVELLVVISILWILAVLWYSSFDTQWAKDTQRTKALRDMAVHLEEFKQRYGSYPNSNSTWRRYPTSGCSVSWHDSLVSCLVSTEFLVEDSETYNQIAFDPTEWEYNDFDQEYAYYYGTANRWNKFKLCSLMWKQENEVDFKWLDGNDASKWSRYWCVTSSNTKLTDVTSMNK